MTKTADPKYSQVPLTPSSERHRQTACKQNMLESVWGKGARLHCCWDVNCSHCGGE